MEEESIRNFSRGGLKDTKKRYAINFLLRLRQKPNKYAINFLLRMGKTNVENFYYKKIYHYFLQKKR